MPLTERQPTTNQSLSILTLNTWGAPYAKQRAARYRAIARYLTQHPPDIVLLQEVFLQQDRQLVLKLLPRETWPYRHDYASGWLGSGLVTLSRYPIIETAFHRFRLGGKPERLAQGDFYAGKGIGLARIDAPVGRVDVYNCHTHAQYVGSQDDDSEYSIYTDSNLYEAARFIHVNSDAAPVVLGGDLNTRPNQSGYALITVLGGLIDSYARCHPDEMPVTFSPANPYVASGPQCLDYLMVRGGLTPQTVDIVMTERLKEISSVQAYSDHYAVRGVFTLTADEDVPTDPAYTGALLTGLVGRIDKGLTDTYLAQTRHDERAAFGLAAVADLSLFGGVLNRWLPRRGGLLRLLLIVGLMAYALGHALTGRGLLETRRQTLQALRDELQHQIDARRAFNDVTWS